MHQTTSNLRLRRKNTSQTRSSIPRQAKEMTIRVMGREENARLLPGCSNARVEWGVFITLLRRMMSLFYVFRQKDQCGRSPASLFRPDSKALPFNGTGTCSREVDHPFSGTFGATCWAHDHFDPSVLIFTIAYHLSHFIINRGFSFPD